MILILQILTLAAVIAALLLGRRFLPAYASEKGKNLATKEDVAAITHEVERARLQYLTELERAKSELGAQSSVLEKRREVYDSMVRSFGIFITGRPAGDAEKQQFLTGYQAMWLWAPDSVIQAVNRFLDFNMQFVKDPRSVDHAAYTESFADVLLAMRRDTGFAATILSPKDFRFLQFGATPSQSPIETVSGRVPGVR